MQREGKHREEEPAGKLRQEENLSPVKKTDDLKDKIILAVLDYLDGRSSVTDAENAEELRTDAARTVSQVLLSSTEAWEITRSSSALDSDTDLDSMLEAMTQSGFPTYTLRSVLDSASSTIIRTIEEHKNMSSYRNFIFDRLTKRTKKKVKAFLKVCGALVKDRGTEFAEAPGAPRPSRTDDLTIRCTNEVIDGIIQVCRPHGGGEGEERGVEEVMQELESIISSRGSPSRNDLEVIDLEESQESSHLPQRREGLLSDEFHRTVKRVISDALLKTTGAASARLDATTDDLVVEDLEMCAEESDTSLESSPLIESAASDMAEAVMEDLKKVSSHQVDDGSVTEPAASRETFRSAARRLYRNVHFKVFEFLLRLQEPRSSSVSKHESTKGEDRKSESVVAFSPAPGLVPRVQLQRCSCVNEDCVKVVELYKSEPLLSSSSCRREFSSAAPTASAADVRAPVAEAAERPFGSTITAWATLDDLSSTTEGPPTSKPFKVFSRVKEFLRDRFTGAGRRSSGHTPTGTGESGAFTEELVEDLLSLLDSHHTIEDRTRDHLTRDLESPGSASAASNRADDSGSRHVDDDVPVDPDPGTVKKVSVRIRKGLRRVFSALRRALPDPFQCMSGPP